MCNVISTYLNQDWLLDLLSIKLNGDSEHGQQHECKLWERVLHIQQRLLALAWRLLEASMQPASNWTLCDRLAIGWSSAFFAWAVRRASHWRLCRFAF